MNSIGMPAFRPTADCIWSSFRSSGKRHLLLTGGRKSGKTTLLSNLFPTPLPGVTTWAQPQKAVYLKDNLTHVQVQIGRYDSSLPGEENKMVPCEDGFFGLGLRALSQASQSDSSWVCIDEIGYLESDCTPYQEAIRALMEKKQLVAALRKQSLPFLRELCDREDVFLVDLDNPYGNSGCVIMASGLGTRFGGNKLMADFRGEPMICRSLAATEGMFSKRVVVTRHSEIAHICRRRGVDVVLHDFPLRSDVVRLGLEAAGHVDRCMFCLGDQPLLKQDTVASLVLAGRNDPDSIWRTAFESSFGSPVLFPSWAFPELLSLPLGKGGGYVIQQHPEHLRTVAVRDPYELMDADTQEDLETLSHR